MPQITTISYVHFPRKARAISDYESIHAFTPTNKTIWSFNWLSNLLIRKIYLLKNKINIRTMIVCNSEFTKKNLTNCYPNFGHSKIKVI